MLFLDTAKLKGERGAGPVLFLPGVGVAGAPVTTVECLLDVCRAGCRSLSGARACL